MDRFTETVLGEIGLAMSCQDLGFRVKCSRMVTLGAACSFRLHWLEPFGPAPEWIGPGSCTVLASGLTDSTDASDATIQYR